MLQYGIEKFLKVQESKPVIIYCSGWLFDTQHLTTHIKLIEHRSSGAEINLLRGERPDIQIFFPHREEIAFSAEIICNDPDDLELEFSSDKESISIPLTELKAGTTILEFTWAMKMHLFLHQCKLQLAYLLSLPLRGMKLIKNKLFQISPGFQKFYFRFIYPLLRRGAVFPSPVEDRSMIPNPDWGEHILVFSHFADGSGAPILALNIVKELYGFGFNLHIILMRDGELHESFSQFGSVDVITSEETLREKLLQWRREGIDIRKAFLNTTLPGIYAGLLKEFGMTVVNLIHEMPGTVTVMGQQEAASVLRKNADKIVLPSTLIQDLWKEADMSLPQERCVILPQPDYHSDLMPVKDEAEKAACHAALCQQLNIPEDSFIVIGCGMLETRKAPDVFFQTALEVCEIDPRIHFIWIGDSGDEFYRRKIKLLLAKNPNNLKLLSYRKLNDYYRGADLFFLSSKEDPFPTVGLLAAKVAVPVVFCRRNTGLRDLFGGIEGCSAEDYSSGIFQEIILHHAANRELSAQRGAAFQKIYREKMYSFRNYVQTLYELAGDKLPRITAIIPNYNYAAFLPARIKSIADQSYPIYELLILDDCSQDNSAEVAEKMIREYSGCFPGGMRYIPNTRNAGVFRQWYKGVSLAQGELIWIAEADDMCLNNMQSQLVHAFTDPKVQIAYAQSALMDKDDNIYSKNMLLHTNSVSQIKWLNNYLWDGNTEIETALAIKNTIPNASATLIRKTAFARIPEDLFSYKVVGDWFAYLHIVQDGKVAYCAKPLNLYRRHPDSVVAKNPERLLAELKKLNEYIVSKFSISNYTAFLLQREILQTCVLLNLSFENLVSEINSINEAKPTEYWMLPAEMDWEDFKNRISQSKASYLFICFEDKNALLPSDVAESFNGLIHVLWKEEIAMRKFRERFTLWKKN